MDEKDWQSAEWTDYFLDIEGNKKPKPTFTTRVKMLWDKEYLYFAAELEEPHVWATLRQRDTIIFYDNDFEIFIDPDGDAQSYFEFEMNANNTVWDLFITKPYRILWGKIIDTWDIKGLKSAVHVNGTLNNPNDTDENWTIEIAIPLRVLNEGIKDEENPRSGDLWRLNFSRVQWQTEVVDGKYRKTINPVTGKHFPENNWVWNPTGVINMHMPEKWGYLQFSENKVGTTKVKTIINPDQPLIYDLWEVYYAMQNYMEVNGKYTDNIEELPLPEKLDKDQFVVESTTSLFEISTRSSKSKNIWHLDQVGRIWKTKK